MNPTHQPATQPERIEIPQQVIRWRTSDGEEFHSLESATYHAEQMDASTRANAILDDGGSVADALRSVGKETSIDPLHEKITKATKLVIEHWQCQSTPGYQVQRFLPNWKLKVWGNAGSWSGSYGGDVSLQDLARYAKHENTKF